MSTVLNIAGHGLKRNGTFDPGASGFVTQGEWRYYAEAFFDKLKKYEPKGVKAVYHTAYNVYDYGNIVNLARQYGKDTKVIEWHFDASASSSARRGHVIVFSGFNPDELDLRLRDGIKKKIGVRYSHKGHAGISGRNNLANVNRCAKGGINYRLIELAFCTNRQDANIMLNEMDDVAKVMSEAIYGVEIKTPQQQDSGAGFHIVKKGDTLWGLGQIYDVKVADLKKWNNLDSDLIVIGQSLEVRGADHPAPKPEPKPKETPPATNKNPIKVGTWVRVPANKLYPTGNANNPVKSREISGQVDRINSNWKNSIRLVKNGTYLGFARPSDITGNPKVQSKTIDQMAQEVIKGLHGNGHENRRKSLGITNTEYKKVRNKVNQLLK